MERIAGENRLDSEHAGAGAFSFPRCFGLDGFDHLRDASRLLSRRLGQFDEPAAWGRIGAAAAEEE